MTAITCGPVTTIWSMAPSRRPNSEGFIHIGSQLIIFYLHRRCKAHLWCRCPGSKRQHLAPQNEHSSRQLRPGGGDLSSGEAGNCRGGSLVEGDNLEAKIAAIETRSCTSWLFERPCNAWSPPSMLHRSILAMHPPLPPLRWNLRSGNVCSLVR